MHLQYGHTYNNVIKKETGFLQYGMLLALAILQGATSTIRQGNGPSLRLTLSSGRHR